MKISHTSINDFFGYKGEAEDSLNRYEFIFDQLQGFRVDQINTTDDRALAEKWVKKFIKTKKISENFK